MSSFPFTTPYSFAKVIIQRFSAREDAMFPKNDMKIFLDKAAVACTAW